MDDCKHTLDTGYPGGTNASFGIERDVESSAFQKAMQEVSRELAKSMRDRT
jgi:hypothetical protein